MLTLEKMSGPNLQTENLRAANALVGHLTTNPGINHSTVCRFINTQKSCLKYYGKNEVMHYKNYENILKFLYANGQIVSIKGTKERNYFLSTQEIPESIMANATGIKSTYTNQKVKKYK